MRTVAAIGGLRLLAAVLSVAVLAGCDPVVCQLRMQPEIVNVEDRVLSFQLVTPGNTCHPERVIYRGILVSALLEDSKDTLSDFSLGYVTWDEWNHGSIKVLKQESGETQVILLGTPPSRSGVLWLDAEVRVLPNTTTVQWSRTSPPRSPAAPAAMPPGVKY